MNEIDLKEGQPGVSGKLRTLGYTVYCNIPASLRLLSRPLLFLKNQRLKKWLINGDEVISRQPLSMFFAGSPERKNYLAGLAFGETYREKYLGTGWSWQIIKDIKEQAIDCPLVVTEVPPDGYHLTNGNNSFFIPSLVSGKGVDVSKDIEEITAGNHARSLRWEIRKIKKNSLYSETTSDLSWFDYFYYRMYLPYSTQRYGNTAIISRYESLKKKFKNLQGELLFVKQGEEFLAGMMLTTVNKTGNLAVLGIKDGNTEYLDMGVLGALYYFSYLYLHGKGYQTMELGRSRAFLKDGLLKYKLKWDPCIDGIREPGFWLNFQVNNDAVRGFLRNNPFIFVDHTGFNGAVFLDSDTTVDKIDFASFHASYYHKGMSRLFVYSCRDAEYISQETIPQNFAHSISSRSLHDSSQLNDQIREGNLEKKYGGLEVITSAK